MEVKFFKAREKIAEGKLKASDTRVQAMKEEASVARAREDEAVAALEVRLKSEEEWWAAFLLSKEFK